MPQIGLIWAAAWGWCVVLGVRMCSGGLAGQQGTGQRLADEAPVLAGWPDAAVTSSSQSSGELHVRCWGYHLTA